MLKNKKARDRESRAATRTSCCAPVYHDAPALSSETATNAATTAAALTGLLRYLARPLPAREADLCWNLARRWAGELLEAGQ